MIEHIFAIGKIIIVNKNINENIFNVYKSQNQHKAVFLWVT